MSRRQTLDEWRVIYGLIVFATACVLLFSMWTIVSPILVFFLFLLLLWPYAGSRRHLILVTAATILLFIWTIDTLGSLLAPFIIAMGIAYIFDPLVDRLEKRMPRMAGVAIIAVPILALLALALIFGIPALVHQIEDLVQGLPTALERIITWFDQVRGRFARLNLPFIDAERIASQLSPERISAYIEQRQAAIFNSLWGAIPGVGRGLSLALTILGYVVLTPVLTIYLLRDSNELTERAAALMPESKRERWLSFLREYDRLLARFLRGQVLAASIVGVLTWLGLLIVGFPYSGLVAAIAGVFNLVPYLGLVASIIPVLLIALLTGSFLTSIIKAGIVFAIVQFIDGSITGPRIVGGSVGLHPVWVILALAVGSFFFGFVGLLLAMPAAVFIKLLIRESLERYRASRVFRGPAPAAGDPAI
jgi:predicted PurR-regulated permease PerM